MSDANLVLASGSPRRRELLTLLGVPFQTVTPQVDESRLPGEPPPVYVTRLSQLKAREAARLLDQPALVLAADTIVALGDDLLGKPRDADHARAMLARLRGRGHAVYSAITLLDMAPNHEVTDLAAIEVPMRDYGDDEVEAYITTGDPFDKAGGYAIQHRGFNPVAAMSGCYAGVMGLPLCHLLRSLRALGHVWDDLLAQVPPACQAHLDYDCLVTADVLDGAPGGHPHTSGL